MEFIIVICEMTTPVWLMILLLLERNCVVTSKLVQTTFRLYENPTGTVNQGGRFNTDFCIQFRITLKSIRSQCHGQRKTLNMQLNLRSVRRIELNTKVCTVCGFC